MVGHCKLPMDFIQQAVVGIFFGSFQGFLQVVLRLRRISQLAVGFACIVVYFGQLFLVFSLFIVFQQWFDETVRERVFPVIFFCLDGK